MERLRRNMHPIRQIGQFPQKSTWVHETFNSLNFSFIFEGGGSYRDHQGIHRIESPCVLTQWPGEANAYGPTEPWGTWNELFIIYSPELSPSITKTFNLPQQKRYWKMQNPRRVRAIQHRLSELTHADNLAENIDRIDLLCEEMIMESLPAHQHCNAALQRNPSHEKILTLQREIDTHFQTIHNIDELAASHGLSRSAFRRLWQDISTTPPARYLMELKLKHACRLLIETYLPIATIAEQVGFNDPYYFSRKFRQRYGIPASVYRKKHQNF
jgi:AraC-like DNA-binding protein